MGEILNPQINTEFITIEKNSRGYNWGIKVCIMSENDVAAVDRIGKLDKLMREKYGKAQEVED